MLFSSITFLFYFLPIVLIGYFITPKKFRNYILLLASIVFYAWGGLLYLPLLLISIIMNYLFGLFIAKNNNKSKKFILILSIILNLLFLGIFKYSNFIISNINNIFSTSINTLNITLPIGISFYTFQAMSYVIDVYRNDGKVQKNIFNLALYISMFPQLVAGPIVRYQTVDDQITDRTCSFEKFNHGSERFLVGLFKKVVLSNTVGELSSIIYALPDWKMSIAGAWLGAIAYTLQIYFDFSGYSDMAIGLGKMFGFDFLENFNYPYISKSVAEFWRRWHISLGSWFRDYIYIPLGGNRVSNIKIYRNLFIVWLVTGIWHGASWNFVVWGLYFGLFIMLERAFLGKILNKFPKLLQHLYLLIIVVVGWVIFSQPTLTEAVDYIKIMFGAGNYPLVNGYPIFYFKEYAIILLSSIVLSTPIIKWIEVKNGLVKNIYLILKPIVLLATFGVSILYLVNSTFNPFIYFNF
ncbi:D-alanyl-lipoteichoic acid biosynthesis protein DltB [uncultured Clostridium sp.]|uniref:MBOAT family O-acyltransferase n=1 Tax=uncultured Clostridium sp. TaxID=59620 RepID=UPI00082035C7|nr:MBOAT family O-acyltransferase [uncultured Clostridium sp.]SCJ39633.1 D-alanyl-lipoteichoic acid biosynthesis protein DltB [uncultured Clostridium sp.]